jgi:hypothetical protein
LINPSKKPGNNLTGGFNSIFRVTSKREKGFWHNVEADFKSFDLTSEQTRHAAG